MNSPLLLSGQTLRIFFLFIAFQFISLCEMAFASTAGSAKLIRCSQRNVNRCELALTLALVEGQNIELYRGRRLVYTGSILRKQQQKYINKYGKYLIDGQWYISSRSRNSLIRSSSVLLIVPTHRQRESDLKLAGNNEDDLDSDVLPVSSNSAPNNIPRSSGEEEPSTIERIEKWANRSDGQDTPRLNLGFRLGTPNSPSAMTGIHMDLFFISTVIPITIAAGEYDSRRFVNAKDFGRLKYQTQSLGTGLLIGKSWTRFKVGLNYTQIQAKFSGKDDSPGYQSKSSTYSGLTPHLGFYGISSGEASYGFEYGFFVPFTQNYRTDPGAPLRSTSNPMTYRNRSQYFSLGLGLAF